MSASNSGHVCVNGLRGRATRTWHTCVCVLYGSTGRRCVCYGSMGRGTLCAPEILLGHVPTVQ
eukprot:2384872-Prymnesium_polylepis.1